MVIRFQRTELVDAPPQRMWSVVTGYERYPAFNRLVRSLTVVRRDEVGAEVIADRRTPIARKVRFFDTYSAPPLLQLTRSYEGQPGDSVWTVEPASSGRSYYTILAEMRVPFVPGIFMYPILKWMFWNLNFPPFIRAAESAAHSSPERGPESVERLRRTA